MTPNEELAFNYVEGCLQDEFNELRTEVDDIRYAHDDIVEKLDRLMAQVMNLQQMIMNLPTVQLEEQHKHWGSQGPMLPYMPGTAGKTSGLIDWGKQPEATKDLWKKQTDAHNHLADAVTFTLYDGTIKLNEDGSTDDR